MIKDNKSLDVVKTDQKDQNIFISKLKHDQTNKVLQEEEYDNNEEADIKQVLDLTESNIANLRQKIKENCLDDL